MPSKPLRGVFVTGTDTGVGKTMVACAIAAWCRTRGLDVGVMKPVATGGRRLKEGGTTHWVSDDARHLARAARSNDPWRLINPVCYREPIAPWTGARRAGTAIRMPELVDACERLRSRHAFLVVEGIGGLLVPLTARLSVSDLAKRLGLPLLIVARAGLGTLNHSLLSLAEARRKRLPVVGFVLNYADPPARDSASRLTYMTNPAMLRELAGVPVFGPLPFVGNTPARRAMSGQWAWQYLDAKLRQALCG